MSPCFVQVIPFISFHRLKERIAIYIIVTARVGNEKLVCKKTQRPPKIGSAILRITLFTFGVVGIVIDPL